MSGGGGIFPKGLNHEFRPIFSSEANRQIEAAGIGHYAMFKDRIVDNYPHESTKYRNGKPQPPRDRSK